MAASSLSLLDTLPIAQRLALTYAPRHARALSLALFAFDARLAQAVRQANEPIMGQMRLAWWRDQLKLATDERERSDELVRALDPFAKEGRALQALVDGWEVLLAEELDENALRALVSARAGAFLSLKRVLDAPDDSDDILQAAQTFALADLVSGLSDGKERDYVLSLAGEGEVGSVSLSRAMRPLAVLRGLARRSLDKGGEPLLSGGGSGLLAMRLGLIGR